MSLSFYERLHTSTQHLQNELLNHPLIQKTMMGNIKKEEYAYFLAQAHYHVKHTASLLMACGSRLKKHQRWMEKPIIEYLNEEQGHDEWILNDLKHLGFHDKIQIEQSACNDIQSFVAYGYYSIEHINPISVFGMVHMLEGTSVKIATTIADVIEKQFDSQKNITSYLRSHGALDAEHVEHFKVLINRVEHDYDQECILASAKQSYQTYIKMLTQVMHESQNIKAVYCE